MMLFSVPAIVYLVWSTMASGIASVSILMQWGLVGEAIDYNELLTGKRTEGSIYGTFNLIPPHRPNRRQLRRRAGTAGSATTQPGRPVRRHAYRHQGAVRACPRYFLVGSWIAFRFVWNITPEIRAKMAASKAAKSAQ